jgi:hypothetical protein
MGGTSEHPSPGPRSGFKVSGPKVEPQSTDGGQLPLVAGDELRPGWEASVLAVAAATTHAAVDCTGWVQESVVRASLIPGHARRRLPRANKVAVLDSPRAIGRLTGREKGYGHLDSAAGVGVTTLRHRPGPGWEDHRPVGPPWGGRYRNPARPRRGRSRVTRTYGWSANVAGPIGSTSPTRVASAFPGRRTWWPAADADVGRRLPACSAAFAFPVSRAPVVGDRQLGQPG